MAYYALIDENNIVTQVISGIDENNTTDLPENFDSWEEFYADFHIIKLVKELHIIQGMNILEEELHLEVIMQE